MGGADPARGELDDVMSALTRLGAAVTEVEARRHDLGRNQQRLEDEISALTEKAAHHDKTLYSGTIGNPRELQALQDEIAALKRRVSQLEDQELELMEQIAWTVEPDGTGLTPAALALGAGDGFLVALSHLLAEQAQVTYLRPLSEMNNANNSF